MVAHQTERTPDNPFPYKFMLNFCRLLCCLWLGCLTWGSVAAQTAAPLRFSYTVAFPQPHTHLYEISLEAANVTTPQLELALPTWTPGSYLQREYARHVQDFAAQAADQTKLAWEKIDKTTWRITTGASGGRPLTVRVFYRVYANELATQTSHLDSTHAYFNGASLFMYAANVAGAKESPLRVRFQLEGPTANWRVASPLALQPDAAGWFTAPNYDVLIDAPTEIGTHQLFEFTVRNKAHRVALWPGLPPGAGISEKQLTGDLAKIIEAGAEIFDGLPYDHYLFIIHAQPGIGGGTEHLNANVSMTTPDAFKTRRGYQGLLRLEAHEYFHCWNVKRIRPIALGPFDYVHENYTNHLWLAEGFTNYYGNQLLRRAGLLSASEYLQGWGRTAADYRQTPGRFVQSATTASFNAWIKHYRPDENSPNSALSYYTKGEILGMLFDLEIRSRTQNAKSVDDVMRLLLARYGWPKPGFTDAELKAAFEQVAGTDLTDFFRRYVYGTDEVEFERYWQMLGLQATGGYTNPSPTLATQDQPPGALGLRFTTRGDRVFVSNVLADLPAYQAGLNNNDELIALDGYKLDAANFTERIAEIRQGQTVQLTIFRRDRLQTVSVSAARRPFDSYALTPLRDASNEQKALLQAWLKDQTR